MEEHPIRIQRKRIKGWKMPKNTVSVTRPGKWGNPFIIGVENEFFGAIETPERSLELYEKFIRHQIKMGMKDISELKGKNLACFCKEGEPCHADVLLKLANK